MDNYIKFKEVEDRSKEVWSQVTNSWIHLPQPNSDKVTEVEDKNQSHDNDNKF